MNKKLLAAVLGLALALSLQPAHAEDDPAISAEFKSVMTNVQARIKDDQHDVKQYADVLKQMDEIIARHADKKSDQLAQILYMEAALHTELTTNADKYDKATAIVERLRKEFPETKQAKNADEMIASFKDAQAAEKIQSQMVAGAPFPDFNETDFDGKPVSVAAHKGKVVLIDFWATWCGPCRAEFPNVKKTYETCHDKGFDIIGVSLDESKEKLAGYIKENGVVWPQYFDGKGWQNKLAAKYGIRSIPATILIDAEGKVIARNLRGEDLQQAVTKALSKGGA